MSQRETQTQTHKDTTSSNTPTSTDSIPSLGEDESKNDEIRYRCPYCDTSYQHELITRIHVIRSEDPNHLNRNGFMPEVEIEILDADGEMIERVSRRPDEIDPSKLTIDSFPDETSTQHKHILLVAAQNAEESTYTTLAQKVEDRFDDYDIDCPSYSTVRRVVRQFYRPHSETESSGQGDPNKESLSALTAKQQAIIIARLLSPKASTNEISDQIGCASSYPSQVFQLAEDIISDLEEQINQGDGPRTVIRNELGEGDIHELVGRELLANVPIHFPSVTDGEGHNTTDWGSPVGHKGGMTAVPDSTDQETQTTDLEAAEQTKLTKKSSTESDTKTAEDDWEWRMSSNKSPKTICDEIEQLQEKVQFLRKVFSHSEVEEDGTQVLVSFSTQIEEHCEDILEEFSGVEQ